jgi:hypothetical protein
VLILKKILSKSAESGDIHSHVFITLLPEDTLKNPKLPNSSFATYVIHKPDAGSSGTRTGFPALYYSYWFMLVLLAGALGFGVYLLVNGIIYSSYITLH